VIGIIAEVSLEASQLEEFREGFRGHIFREAGVGFGAFPFRVGGHVGDAGLVGHGGAVDVGGIFHDFLH